MQMFCVLWGFAAVAATVVAFFPCLGALNWLVVPFCALGLVVSIVVFVRTPLPRGAALFGIVLCGLALAVSWLRLQLGGGIV